MINIYSGSTTTFNNNGLATLIPLSCEISVGINGAWQLELEHPFDKEQRYKHLVKDAILRVTNLDFIGEWESNTQLFRIYDTKKTLTSITVIAFPIALEATYDAPIQYLNIDDETGAQAAATLDNYVKTVDANNKYTISSNITFKTWGRWNNTNLIAAISGSDDNSFVNHWGGEVIYDSYKIKILDIIGDQNNARAYPIRYGRNLMGLTYEVDTSSVVTRLYPISKEGIRLNTWADVTDQGGNQYVDTARQGLDYPFVRSRFLELNINLIDTDKTKNDYLSNKTEQWRVAMTDAMTATAEAIWTAIVNDTTNTYKAEYVKTLISGEGGLSEYLQNKFVFTIKSWQSFVKSCAKNAVSWISKEKINEWEWHEDTSVIPHAWWYGDDSETPAKAYAKNCYVKIGKEYYYFNNDGYWEDYKNVSDMGWYQSQENGKWWYGNRERYYAHNEYVFMTVEGTMRQWWYDEEGWYDEDSSGESNYGWHGDASSGYWFGEEGASADDKSKYLHDRWAFIDGTYYWFDSYGYTDADPAHSMPDYPWGDLVDEQTGKHWFGNTDKNLGMVYLKSQWMKIDNEWRYFDSEGYLVDMDAKKSETIAWLADEIYTANIALVKSKLTEAYQELYDFMTGQCEYYFEDEGWDLPTINVTADLIDLSKTAEYKAYRNLERIHLGDKVEIESRDGERFEERVVGLTYDCIRGYNTKVEVGQLSKTVGQIVSTNYKGSGSEQRLIAGDNVVIEGNIISVADYVGRTIGLQDVLLNGSTCVSGNVANFGITEGSHVHISRNGNILTISADSGALEHFIETENTLYGHDTTTKYLRNDANYKFDSGVVMHNYSQRDDIDHNYYKHTASNVDNNDIVGYHAGKIDSLLASYADIATGFCIISKVASHCTFTYEFFNSQYPADESSPTYSYTYSYDSANKNVTTSLPSRMSDVSATCDTFTYNNETYYIVADGATWDWISPQTNIEDILDLGKYVKEFEDNYTIQNDQGTNVFNTLGEYGLAVVKAHTQRNSYNGIAKKDGLAFFAGGTDANGSDAPIKIYDDGTAEGLVTEVDLDKKQDKLIEGANIHIGADGKTISATDTDEIAELEDVSLTNLADGEILKYNATTQKWENAEDSGGSEVEANPSGTATDTLTKLGIDGTIYEIQGGGGGTGGSSVYSEKQLYKASVDSFQNISVTWDWEEYDAYIFNAHDTCLTTSYKQNGDSTILTKAQIKNLIDTELKQYIYRGNGYTVYVFSDSTITANTNSGGFFITEIIGLKFGTLSPIIYSTEEREVGVWVDGRPLYQKTFITNVTLTSGVWAATGDSVLNGKAIDAEVTTIGQGSDTIPVWCEIGSDGHIELLNIRGSGQVTITHYTVRYFKTTDVAGSGQYTTLGVPAVHYTTDEQVIGTWFGETLYRKVFDFSNNPITVPTDTWLKVVDAWQIQPIRGTVIIPSSTASLEVATDCDSDGLYIRSWLGYSNVTRLIVEYTKTS